MAALPEVRLALVVMSDPIHAVLSAPDDDAVRLEHAGRLVRAGDPRGRFIQLQCEVARLSDDDSRRASVEASLARVPVLPEWSLGLTEAGLKMPSLRPSEPWQFKPPWTFCRGYVEHLFVDADALVNIGAELARAYPIRSLAIPGLKTGNAAELAGQSWLSQIVSLSTTGSAAAVTKLLASPHLTGLKRLRLSTTAASLPKVFALPALHTLRALDLDVPDDRRAAALALADGGPLALEELTFGSTPNGWGSATGQRTTRSTPAGDAIAVLLESPRMANVRKLRLHETGDARFADALGELGHLEDLHVSSLEDHEVAMLAVLPCSRRLRRLSLDAVGPAAIRAFSGVELPRLTHLVLENRLGSVKANVLPSWFSALRAPALRSLHLPECPIEREFVRALVAIDAPNLVELEISGTSVDARALEALAGSPLMQRLLTFSCSGGAESQASDRVHALLRTPLPRLQRLAIGDAPRGDQADEAIALLARSSLPELRHLGFSYAGNIPSFGSPGARALLASSVGELAILYVNPTGVSTALRRELEIRFAIHPGASWSSDRLPFVARGVMEA